MFGLTKLKDEFNSLGKCVCMLHDEITRLRKEVEELRKANEEAIVNRETITNFIDDLTKIIQKKERKTRKLKPKT